MASYNREQATGDENHNLIAVVMLELGLDRSGAMAWVARYHAEVAKRFTDGLANLKVSPWEPSVDVLVKEYLDGIATWARANHCWSYESKRLLDVLVGVNDHSPHVVNADTLAAGAQRYSKPGLSRCYRGLTVKSHPQWRRSKLQMYH
jgi:hypothetical protein